MILSIWYKTLLLCGKYAFSPPLRNLCAGILLEFIATKYYLIVASNPKGRLNDKLLWLISNPIYVENQYCGNLLFSWNLFKKFVWTKVQGDQSMPETVIMFLQKLIDAKFQETYFQKITIAFLNQMLWRKHDILAYSQ